MTADSHHIDCLGIVETNINWKNQVVQNQVIHTLRKYWRKTIIKGSSNQTSNFHTYLPGGTLTLLGNHWTGGGRAYEDPSGMGRWTEVGIHGRQNRQVRIITVYRVPHTTIAQAGTNTSFYNQWHYLRRKGDPKPDPRSQLLTDLGHHIQQLTQDHIDSLILMDANEAYSDRHSSLHAWIHKHSLTDVHMYLHQHDTAIPTHVRGTKRIDYVFATPSLLP